MRVLVTGASGFIGSRFVHRLTEEGQLFGQQPGRVCVPVIAVSVGDEQSFHVLQEFLRRNRQGYEWVLARVGRILDGGSRACLIEHGIHDHLVAVVFDDERSMPDQAKAHDRDGNSCSIALTRYGDPKTTRRPKLW